MTTSHTSKTTVPGGEQQHQRSSAKLSDESVTTQDSTTQQDDAEKAKLLSLHLLKLPALLKAGSSPDAYSLVFQPYWQLPHTSL
ncbi:MAG: hypothetical protein LKF41_00070 [Bifidobacterium sp.]|nr:hypothetical protein [Bifidobacterium sp.]MCH4174241.1 hypothetical protein [Bifidobacterium sp.]